MTTILCATRGGEASVRTQHHAIALAQERGAELAFLYITDGQFLNGMSAAITVDVTTELEHMGEFLLLMAKERAEEAGVTTTTLVKRGDFQEALCEAAQDVEASLIVLGSPGETTLTGREFLDQVAASITEETGIEVIIV